MHAFYVFFVCLLHAKHNANIKKLQSHAYITQNLFNSTLSVSLCVVGVAKLLLQGQLKLMEEVFRSFRCSTIGKIKSCCVARPPHFSVDDC